LTNRFPWADLLVLEGASALLEKSILAVKSEVNFSRLYINQPLFADLDTHLRGKIFTIFDLSKAYRPHASSPILSTERPGKILWGDAIYLRDLRQEGLETPLKTPEKMLKLAGIADLLKFTDYSLELWEYLTLN
jgi:hypothetical protein